MYWQTEHPPPLVLFAQSLTRSSAPQDACGAGACAGRAPQGVQGAAACACAGVRGPGGAVLVVGGAGRVQAQPGLHAGHLPPLLRHLQRAAVRGAVSMQRRAARRHAAALWTPQRARVATTIPNAARLRARAAPAGARSAAMGEPRESRRAPPACVRPCDSRFRSPALIWRASATRGTGAAARTRSRSHRAVGAV